MTGSTLQPIPPSSGQESLQAALQIAQKSRQYKKLDTNYRVLRCITDGEYDKEGTEINVRFWYKICKHGNYEKPIPGVENWIVISIPVENYKKLLNNEFTKDFATTLSYVNAKRDEENDEWKNINVIRKTKINFSIIEYKDFGIPVPKRALESPELSQYLYDFALGQGDFAPKQAPKTNPKA